MPNEKANPAILSLIKDSILSQSFNSVRETNFYIQEDAFTKRSLLPVPRKKVVAERPTVMVFADDAPLYNWAHPCRYLLHDAETGELYQEVAAQFPPYLIDKDTPKSFVAFHVPVTFGTPVMYRLKPELIWHWWGAGQRYAILFSGMSNNRHTNDLEFAYRTLINVYGFSPANIIVLNYNGTLNYSGSPQPATSWPGDGSAYTMPVHGQGSKAKLLAALDSMKSKLKADDLLFIHTNNHGGHNGIESDLCCYPNWDSLGVKEFTDKLAELPRYRCLMVMMEQCHSGGFNSSVISKSTADNTSIASACIEANNSIGGADFDPFARDWISAMMGNDPYGHALHHNPDASGNGRVSAKEAFDYADAIHHSYDTPIFNYKNGGRDCWLGRTWFRLKYYVEIQKQIRKFWPEPDPIKLREKFAKVETDLLKLNESYAKDAAALEDKAAKQAIALIEKMK
jgi:hypothetical protein